MKKFVGILACLFAGSVNAALIDFESVPTPASCNAVMGGPVDGFTLQQGSGGFNDSCANIISGANSGSNYMLNFNSRTAVFTKDAGVFDLNSLFVHADLRVGDTTVRFQGLDGLGGNILYSMDVDIVASWQQVSFTGWDDMTTFTWSSLNPNSSNIAIDDFVYNETTVVATVPEPSMLALLVMGIAGVSFSRRKKYLSN